MAAATLAASLLAVLAFVVATGGKRVPYWGEAEVLFEASRIRSGLPLFVDPLIGAADRGLPPSRWYVPYPPILSAAMSLVPGRAAMTVGRVIAAAAWFGLLGGIAATAPRERRLDAAAAAAFVG